MVRRIYRSRRLIWALVAHVRSRWVELALGDKATGISKPKKRWAPVIEATAGWPEVRCERAWRQSRSLLGMKEAVTVRAQEQEFSVSSFAP